MKDARDFSPPRNDDRRIAVFQIGAILAFDTPAGHFQYDMASDDEVAENNFVKLFRREEKRLVRLSKRPLNGLMRCA
jgi:hypothetical protein